MKTKEQKAKIIENLGQMFKEYPGVAICAYQGLKMKELNELRDKIRPLGGKYMIVKNTLASIAAKGTPHEQIMAELDGPVALAFLGEDASAILKEFYSFAKSHQALQMLEGNIEGEALDETGLKMYSELPTKNEVRSMFVGVLSAPLSQTVNVLNGPARQLVGVVNAYEDKLGGEQAA